MFPHCPYAAGAELHLVYTPSDPVLQLAPITSVILQSFAPFTKSQVLLVRIQDPPPTLPDILIVKLFDRRFIDEREVRHPWSPESEARANARWQAILDGKIKDDYEVVDSDEYDTAHWEERFLQDTHYWFDTEREAYLRLKDLQGNCVPVYYGAVTVPSSVHPVLSEHYHVRGILLEYVQAPTLADIDPSLLAPRRTLIRSLLVTIRALASCGVKHNDVRSHNILIVLPPAGSPRAVVFDFAFARLRDPDDTDEMWDAELAKGSDIGAIKHHLHRRGLRDKSPVRLQAESNGYEDYNQYIEWFPNTWRLRWYDPVSEEQQELDMHDKAKGYKPARWRLRDDVTAWLDKRDAHAPEGMDRPRPGSPDYKSNT